MPAPNGTSFNRPSLFRYLRRWLTLPIRFDALEDDLAQQGRVLQHGSEAVERRLGEIAATLRALEESQRQISTEVQRLPVIERALQQAMRHIGHAAPWKPADRALLEDPEFGLMSMLIGFLGCRVALDVGANTGRLTELLLDAGYTVHAFEPAPEPARLLRERMSGRPGFHLHTFALGAAEAALSLHLAEGSTGADDASLYSTFHPHPLGAGLTFTRTVDVPVKPLVALVASGTVPPDIGLLKIDTEGHELEVVRGMGSLRPSVVVAEFWGDDFAFTKGRVPNAPEHPDRLRAAMLGLGYWWSVAVFRLDGSRRAEFLGNPASTPARSWGNFFFFRDRDLFLRCLEWLEAELPYLAEEQERLANTSPDEARPAD